MKIGSKREILILLIGDILMFMVALWLAILSRGRQWPDWIVFTDHLQPFAIIFLVWILVFFIADLYRRQTRLALQRLPQTMLNALLVNVSLAVLFFYFIPYFGITPKTLLFIDLFWTVVLIFSWRLWLSPKLIIGQKEKIYFACSGPEVDELKEELTKNPKYNVEILSGDLSEAKIRKQLSLLVINPYEAYHKEVLWDYYKLLFSKVRFVAVDDLYEDLFGRVPMSLIDEKWFLENISWRPKTFYDGVKRLIDIVVALIGFVLSWPFYILVWVLTRVFDRGALFSLQGRVGQDGRMVTMIKFRTMTKANDGGNWGGENKNQVTRLGGWWRKTRIDELPQLINVLRGEMSLVGPRPEFPAVVKEYIKQIPFYQSRLLVKPGLSGWAQVYHDNHAHHGLAIDSTKEKLSYDLFYIKNRSLWLDLKIVLQTIKIILSIKGK